MRWFVFVLLLTLPALGAGAELPTGFLDQTVVVDGQEYAYQVYVPRGYDRSTKWPLTLFLHGAGERGDNGLAPTDVGLGRAIRLHPERWPTLVVFPQVPTGRTWQETSAKIALAALDRTIEQYCIDSQRVYLTGLSLGGHGTWYLGYHHPERFAALVPVCGYVDGFPDEPSFLPASSTDRFAALAARVQQLPIWIVHGASDTVVPVEQSQKMAAALQAVGAEVHYQELPGVNHNAWDPAYGSEELANWLFAQRKPAASKQEPPE